MKNYIKSLAVLAALSLGFVSCEQASELDGGVPRIAFEQAKYEIGAEGGELTVSVLADVAEWNAYLQPATSQDSIDGITISETYGKGSNEKFDIVLTFGKNEDYDRSVIFYLTDGGTASGATIISQAGSKVREMEEITVAEFLKKDVDASIYYKIKGIVGTIAHELYSNFTLIDLDGEASVYIYGLGYESDPSSSNVSLLKKEGINEGDIITIATVRSAYNGNPQGGSSYYISHEKSQNPSISLGKEVYYASASGEEFTLSVTSNKVTWTLSSDVDWLSFDPATGSESTDVKVTVAPGEGGEGKITLSAEGLDPVTCVVTRASLEVKSLAEFKALEDNKDKAYQISGIVTSIKMDSKDDTKPSVYGNFYICDNTDTLYIYGLLPEKGGEKAQDVITSMGIKVGDYVSLAAPKSSYNGAPQAVDTWPLAHYSLKTNEEFKALPDDATKSVFYTVSGTVTSIVMDKSDATNPNKFGNIHIEDEAGTDLYVYGVLDWEGNTANFASLGVAVGDKITGYAYKSSYQGSSQAVNLQPVVITKVAAGGDEGEDGGEGDGGDEGDTPSASVVKEVVIGDLGWANEEAHSSLSIDDNVTVSVTGTAVGNYGLNTGKYYTNGANWRVYQNESPSITFTVASGFVLKSVVIEYSSSKNGVLVFEGANVTSGQEVSLSGSSAVFSVGNTGTATNGQVRITKIKVTYEPDAK